MNGRSDYVLRMEDHLQVQATNHQNWLAQIKATFLSFNKFIFQLAHPGKYLKNKVVCQKISLFMGKQTSLNVLWEYVYHFLYYFANKYWFKSISLYKITGNTNNEILLSKHLYHYHCVCSRGNVFVVCVCMFINFEAVDIEISFLVWWYILTISRSSLSTKVIGSRSQNEKC